MVRGTTYTARQVALKHGYRSGLEDEIAQQLEMNNVKYSYEPYWVPYIKPARKSKYKPDFVLPNGIVIETKGRFVTADRQKHLLLKEQYPDLDVRFVFSNPSERISKKSATTYAMWCCKHGFKYAKRAVPEEWMKEKENERSVKVLRQFENGTG
jgi:hypothetical protein